MSENTSIEVIVCFAAYSLFTATLDLTSGRLTNIDPFDHEQTESITEYVGSEMTVQQASNGKQWSGTLRQKKGDYFMTSLQQVNQSPVLAK